MAPLFFTMSKQVLMVLSSPSVSSTISEPSVGYFFLITFKTWSRVGISLGVGRVFVETASTWARRSNYRGNKCMLGMLEEHLSHSDTAVAIQHHGTQQWPFPVSLPRRDAGQCRVVQKTGGSGKGHRAFEFPSFGLFPRSFERFQDAFRKHKEWVEGQWTQKRL